MSFFWFLAYVYTFILLSSMTIFFLSMRYQQIREKGNLFETVSVQLGKQQRTSVLLSVAASGIVLVVIMVVLLTGLWLLSKKVGGGGMIVVFLLLIANLFFRIVSDSQLMQKISWFASRPRLKIAVMMFFAGSLGSAWFVFPSWITYDLTFFAITISALRTMGPVKLPYLVAGLTAVVGYDIWGVFVSKFIVELAEGFGSRMPPLMLIVPLHPLSWSMDAIVAIGAGDIVLPGIAIITASQYRLEKAAMLGYAVGVLLTLILVVRIGSVPALITLVPCVLGAMLIGYLIQKMNIRWQEWRV